MGLLAVVTPSFVHPIFRDLDGRWWRQLNDLATTRHCDPCQIGMTIWTGSDEMLLRLRWGLSFAGSILLWLALLAGPAFLGLACIRFHLCLGALSLSFSVPLFGSGLHSTHCRPPVYGSFVRIGRTLRSFPPSKRSVRLLPHCAFQYST